MEVRRRRRTSPRRRSVSPRRRSRSNPSSSVSERGGSRSLSREKVKRSTRDASSKRSYSPASRSQERYISTERVKRRNPPMSRPARAPRSPFPSRNRSSRSPRHRDSRSRSPLPERNDVTYRRGDDYNHRRRQLLNREGSGHAKRGRGGSLGGIRQPFRSINFRGGVIDRHTSNTFNHIPFHRSGPRFPHQTSPAFSLGFNGPPPSYRSVPPHHPGSPPQKMYHRQQRLRVDRCTTCPFLLRIYVRAEEHHPVDDLQQLLGKTADKKIDPGKMRIICT